MKLIASSYRGVQMSTPHAALVAGLAYLLNPVSYAEFSIYPKLVMPGNMEQTAQNIAAHGGQFLLAIFCYLSSAIGDVVLAWALYQLLLPAGRSLSLLMAWFQLVYSGIFIVASLNLVGAYQLATAPQDQSAFGPAILHAQLSMQLHAFRYDWGISLILFGIHLVLLGILIYRSGYIPRVLGIVLVVNGVGWMIDSIGPYAFPKTDLAYVQVSFLGELIFMGWLLIRGWKIPAQPADIALA